jgi:zinc protease
MIHKHLKVCLLLVIATCFAAASPAQMDWNKALPLNPKVTTGKLSNGITYYILPNAKPEKKVELRLVLNTGSLSEDDNQLGLAHMCEHMAFNGTKNFKKNEIVSFLQDIGVGFGSDLNAYTFFDRTVYILPIPTDKPGNLEKGFKVLEDWAHQVTYLNEDIDNERAIILEESRLGKGAGDRMQQQWLPGYFNGSRYGSRLPIGKDSIIRNFPHEVIKKFYKDWYRPDLMAVVVVGDIPAEKAKQMVETHFSTIPVVATPRALPVIDFPAYTTDKAIVVTDKEATGYSIQVVFPAFPSTPLVTFGDYKTDLIRSLFTSMLNTRFREITQKPNPPFLFAGGDFESFVRGYRQFGLQASTGNENPVKAMDVLLLETERVKQFGFTANELERAKKNMMANYESAWKSREKTESVSLTDEYINHYLAGTATPGIEAEYEYVQKLLPDISLKEVNDLTTVLKGEQKKYYVITGPENPANFKLPTSDEVLVAATKASAQKVMAYEENAVAKDLLKKMPVAGKVVSRKADKVSGSTELTLSNGLTVILKPTDFKDDEVVMTAARFGGTSNYPVKDLYSARYAGPVQGAMGYGDFTPADLQKVLSGKKVAAGSSITETRDNYSGNSTVKDMETMFQLLHLKITSQRKDTALFSSFIKKQKSSMAMAMANPQTAFIDTLGKFLYKNNPMAPISIPKPSDFDQVNLDRSIEIFKERIADPTGMVFVITGSFKEENIVPMIEKYIASLPVSGKKTAFVDRKVRPVKGNNAFNFNKGKEQKSLVVQVFSGEVPYSADLDLKAQALTESLNIRIIEEIREKLQAIYGGGIQGGLSNEPYSSYQLLAFLPTGPEKVDTVLMALKAEMKKMQDNGPSKEVLDKVKKQWLETHRESIKDNNVWAAKLLATKMEKEDIKRFINYETYVNRLTTADIRSAAKQLLVPNNMVTAVQLPEKATTNNNAATNVAGRAVTVAKTVEISSSEITLELYDNAEVDGDKVSLFFNGTKVVNNQPLTAQPLTVKIKAVKGNNQIVMFAENLGTVPPNTAYLVIKAGDKEYKLQLESDMKQSAAINLVLQ